MFQECIIHDNWTSGRGHARVPELGHCNTMTVQTVFLDGWKPNAATAFRRA